MELSEAQNLQKIRNSQLSLGLILLNLILAYALSFTIQPAGESVWVLSAIFVMISAVLSLAIYAFSYHGKGYRWAKLVLALVLIIAVASISFLFLAFNY